MILLNGMMEDPTLTMLTGGKLMCKVWITVFLIGPSPTDQEMMGPERMDLFKI